MLYDHSQNISLTSVDNKMSNDEERHAEKMMTPSFKQDLFTSNDKVKHRAMGLSREGRREKIEKRRKSAKTSKTSKRKETVQIKPGHGFYSSESENSSLPPINKRERRSNISCNAHRGDNRTDKSSRNKGSSESNLEYNTLGEWATLSQRSLQTDKDCKCAC